MVALGDHRRRADRRELVGSSGQRRAADGRPRQPEESMRPGRRVAGWRRPDSPSTTTCTSRAPSAIRSRTSGTWSAMQFSATWRSSGRSRSPARTRPGSCSCCRRVISPPWRSVSASTSSSPMPRAGSSPTRSCYGSASSVSGSPWPTAMSCCGRKEWRCTPDWTWSCASRTSHRSSSRDRGLARSCACCSATASFIFATFGCVSWSCQAFRSSCHEPGGRARSATSCICRTARAATTCGRRSWPRARRWV